MSRYHLHVSKVEDFKLWAAVQGYEVQPPRGAYQLFVLKRPDERPLHFYLRDRDQSGSREVQHVTAPRGEEPHRPEGPIERRG